MNTKFKVNEVYNVWASIDGERKVVSNATVIEICNTGKVKFVFNKTEDLAKVYPNSRKARVQQKSLLPINTLKNGEESQFCQLYVKDTDSWITMYSNNMQEK